MPIKKIMELFRGLDRAYGVYNMDQKNISHKGDKITGRPYTVQKDVTQDLWQKHLDGINGLGIVPIMDNSCCYFGAIDIDVYNGLNVKNIIESIDKNSLPLVPCRTKSGGVHCFCFVSKAIPAKIMREKLTSFAALLGFGGSEIFPKQDEILASRGDIGQWINMPYYNAKKTDRYAYKKDLTAMNLEEFIESAFKKRTLDKAFAEFCVVEPTGDLSDGPPCLQHLLQSGFSSGSRNDGLFCLSVYLKKSNPDTWRSLVEEYNAKYVNPPLTTDEVALIVKSMSRKDYQYTCDKNPMKKHCNADTCKQRRYGIKQLFGMPKITNLTKYDSRPPVWFVDVEGGGRLELTTEDLQSQTKFQRRCMEALNTMPPMLKMDIWQTIVQGLLESTTVIEAPVDASPRGMMFEHLEKFCTSRMQARAKDELLLGKPWTEGGYHFFRMVDFMSFLERQRFYDFKLHQISSIIKEYGGESCFFKIKGKGVNAWKIKEFDQQNEPFSVPDFNEEVF